MSIDNPKDIDIQREKEAEENDRDLKELSDSDAAKGDPHSSQIPEGVDKDEFLESFGN